MIKCEHCNVDILSGQMYCPLCGNQITVRPKGNIYYPQYAPPAPKPYRFWLRFFTFCSIVSVIACGVINLLTGGYPWSVLVAGGVGFLWLSVGLLLQKKNWIKSIINDAFSIMLLLIVLDAFTRPINWSVCYLAPFILLGISILITVVIIARPLRVHDYLIYQLVVTACSIVLEILVLCSLITPEWPAVVCLGYNLTVILGMLVFGSRKMRGEVRKKLHF